MEDPSCKTPRWQLLKARLNNLPPERFAAAIKSCRDPVVIDVRTPVEFQSGHIPNAININYLAPDFWDRIEAMDPRQHFYVYCRTGRRSIRTCTLMRNGGFDESKLFNLEGGYVEWLATNPIGKAVNCP